jgi:hypothetical protein
MTIDDLDHFQQKIADSRYEFELRRAADFARDSRSSFAAEVVGRAVSG